MENNFKDIINDIKAEIGTYDLSETPIPFSMVQNDETAVFLTEEVSKKYLELVKLINNEETAKEYTFVLLGKKGLLSGAEIILFEELIYTFKDISKLKRTECHHDEEILTDSVYKKNYPIISIGHTHPMVQDIDVENKIANKLSDYLKTKYKIKKPGLNLSGADLTQLKNLIPQINGKEVYQTILLPGGEMFIIGFKDNKYFKYKNILALYKNKDIDISLMNEYFCENKYIK